MKTKEAEVRSKVTQSKSRNRIVQALMEAKRKGKLTGIVGRLGDLGTIDPKYDIAVSSACGRLDNIVVETTEDGMKAVDFLKEHNLGRTTFIMLEKMADYEGRWNSWSGAPEDCPRLIDVAQPKEERLKAAFYFAFGDTIVTKDLDQGTRISRQQRLRMVTLDGKLIETSGAMSGGGRPTKGKMQLSSRRCSVGDVDEDFTEDGLRNLQDSIATKSERIDSLEEEINSLQRKQETINNEILTMKKNAPRLEMDVKAFQDQLETLRKNISDAETAVKESTPDPKMTTELDKKLEAAIKKFKNVEAEANQIDSKIEEIDSQIKQVVNKKLGSAKKKLEKIKSELSSCNSELAKKTAARKTAERNIEKSQAKITQLDNDVQSSIAMIEQLKQEKKQLEVEAEAVTVSVTQLREEKEVFEEELQQIRRKVSKIDKKESSLNSANLDLRHEVEKLGTVVEEKQVEVSRWNDKLSSLQLQGVPDDDFNPDAEEEYSDQQEVEDGEEQIEEEILVEEEYEEEGDQDEQNVPEGSSGSGTISFRTLGPDNEGGDGQEKGPDDDTKEIGRRRGQRKGRRSERSRGEKGVDDLEEETDAKVQQKPISGDEAQDDNASCPSSLSSPVKQTKKRMVKKVVQVVRKKFKKIIVQLKRKMHSLPTFSSYELINFDERTISGQIKEFETELKEMKPNMAAIEDYKKKLEIFLERSAELSEVTEKRDMFKSQFESIRLQRTNEFKEGFFIITSKLKEMYRMITAGGDADLEWADSLDPFSEGINFSVRPNKKSWKKISNLSGGEKTLSSLSLIFALHYYKPSPLYVMDEIDAALDFKNVSIVAHYIKERTKNTQFIIISLRNNMYELANRLVGIYKTHNCTKTSVLIYSDFPSDLTKIINMNNKESEEGGTKRPLSSNQQMNKVPKTSTQVSSSASQATVSSQRRH